MIDSKTGPKSFRRSITASDPTNTSETRRNRNDLIAKRRSRKVSDQNNHEDNRQNEQNSTSISTAIVLAIFQVICLIHDGLFLHLEQLEHLIKNHIYQTVEVYGTKSRQNENVDKVTSGKFSVKLSLNNYTDLAYIHEILRGIVAVFKQRLYYGLSVV